MRLPIVALGLSIISGQAFAETCTVYEAQVFELLDEAIGFQKKEKFKEYGFGAGGPYNKWLKRMQALQTQPDEGEFFRKYEFSATSVYTVAAEYMTEGRLDDFYQGIENTILDAPRCDLAGGATTDENIEIAFIAWAGTNCGGMIPMEEFGRALQHIDGLGKERAAAYRRQVKDTIEKASTTAVACQSVKDALGR